MTRHYLYGQTKCATCKGKGQVTMQIRHEDDGSAFAPYSLQYLPCPDCGGSGYTTTTVLLDGGNLRLVHDDDA